MKLIPFSRYQISGHSMEPTLKTGQIVWVNNWAYFFNKVKTADVVVFKKDGQELVKRVIKVDKDEIFVTGDNKTDSLDSNNFGAVSQSLIVGKVLF